MQEAVIETIENTTEHDTESVLGSKPKADEIRRAIS
jgi:hypothetical protein